MVLKRGVKTIYAIKNKLHIFSHKFGSYIKICLEYKYFLLAIVLFYNKRSSKS